MSLGTILLIIVVIALLGGFSGLGGGYGYGYGHRSMGVLGTVVVILLVLVLLGRQTAFGKETHRQTGDHDQPEDPKGDGGGTVEVDVFLPRRLVTCPIRQQLHADHADGIYPRGVCGVSRERTARRMQHGIALLQRAVALHAAPHDRWDTGGR